MSERLGFEHLTKRFGAQTVFDDFSLYLPMGQASCLMGPSGSGKTTLLRLLMGLEQPDLGRVYTFQPISAVFQEDRLLEGLTALQNLRLVLGKGQDARALQMLQALHLGEEKDKPVSAFSGGMKRRVAIARALLSESKLILLDEPFKGLDEETRIMTANIIQNYSMGKTLVMVTHDAEEARLLGASIFPLSATHR